jgi:hypothetical protein
VHSTSAVATTPSPERRLADPRRSSKALTAIVHALDLAANVDPDLDQIRSARTA